MDPRIEILASNNCRLLAEWLVTELRVNRPPASPESKKTLVRVSGKHTHYNVVLTRGSREIRAFVSSTSPVLSMPPVYSIEITATHDGNTVVFRNQTFTFAKPIQFPVGKIAREMLNRLKALNHYDHEQQLEQAA